MIAQEKITHAFAELADQAEPGSKEQVLMQTLDMMFAPTLASIPPDHAGQIDAMLEAAAHTLLQLRSDGAEPALGVAPGHPSTLDVAHKLLALPGGDG